MGQSMSSANAVGLAVGFAVGDVVGLVVGLTVGECVGLSVGDAVGEAVGEAVGDDVGLSVGDAVGEAVGEAVGDEVGLSVGDTVGLCVTSTSRPGPDTGPAPKCAVEPCRCTVWQYAPCCAALSACQRDSACVATRQAAVDLYSSHIISVSASV